MAENQLKIKSLKKMTTKELRQVALTMENIVGIRAMNKFELIASIQESCGNINDSKQINKKIIREIKNKRKQLLIEYNKIRFKKTSTNKFKVKKTRKQLNRFKKMTRIFSYTS